MIIVRNLRITRCTGTYGNLGCAEPLHILQPVG
ncbi:Uncharacterised protein [Segatella copri]|nr:Uncharacterised protein [Segatella copri]